MLRASIRIGLKMKLIEKQILFCANMGEFLHWFHSDFSWEAEPKLELRFAEGYVGDSIDKPSEDTPHLRYGTHFLRIGQDLILHIDGIMIDNVEQHPLALTVYEAMMNKWESLHPMNRCGGRWKKRDYAHFSMEHNGVA